MVEIIVEHHLNIKVPKVASPVHREINHVYGGEMNDKVEGQISGLYECRSQIPIP